MRTGDILLGAASMLAASLSSSGAAAPPTQGAKPATAAPAALSENALRLSRLVNSSDKMLELGMRGFEGGIQAELKRKPEEAAIYARNPGLLDAILAAARPVMRKHLLAVIPQHQQRFAGFYAGNFTPEEIDQLIAFYSSPTGAKVIDAMYAGMDVGKIVAAAGTTPESPLTARQVGEFNNSAAATLPDKFDAEDWKAMFIFAASPVRAKLQRLSPALNQLVADVENEPDPAFDADLDKAIERAVKTYLGTKAALRAH